MEQKFDGKDLIWTVLYLGLSAIFVGVIILMCTENGFNHDEGRNMFITITAPLDIKAQYSYSGYALGGMAYLLFLLVMRCVPNAWHNLNSFMRYLTHELTHLLMCILCFWRINEFVVRPEKEECWVSYKPGHFGKDLVALSPYCIPIFTIMLLPFRFWGGSSQPMSLFGVGFNNMVIIDTLIAFTYSFHIHSFILQIRPREKDIQSRGLVRSSAFIFMVHLICIALLLAIPQGGVENAVSRVFREYPGAILRLMF